MSEQQLSDCEAEGEVVVRKGNDEQKRLMMTLLRWLLFFSIACLFSYGYGYFYSPYVYQLPQVFLWICVWLFFCILLNTVDWVGVRVLIKIFLVLLIFVGFFGPFSIYVETVRSGRALPSHTLRTFLDVKGSMRQYIEREEKIPEADRWCDELTSVSSSEGINWRIFNPIHDKGWTVIALNNQLGGVRIDQLSGKEVLAFEADVPMNSCGGETLFRKERYRDQFYFSRADVFAYVLFVDGTIGRYRLGDKAISLYIEGSNTYRDFDEFPLVFKKDSEYLPLDWGSERD